MDAIREVLLSNLHAARERSRMAAIQVQRGQDHESLAEVGAAYLKALDELWEYDRFGTVPEYLRAAGSQAAGA